MFGTVLLLMATFATALGYGWGGVLAARHMLDLGTVVAFTALLGRMYFPLMGLSNVQVTVMTALVSFERIFEVLDLQADDRGEARCRGRAPGPAGRAVRACVVPLSHGRRSVAGLAGIHRGARAQGAAADGAAGHRLQHRAREAGGAGGPFGRGQNHDHAC